MTVRKQHVDFYRKLLLRKRLCSKAVDGAVYVPFVGDGDLAVALYADRPIYAADIDPKRVETARARLPHAEIRTADCNVWPFPDISEPFAIGDLDAYCNPYLALEAFWAHAQKTRRVVLFGTDGLKQLIARKQSVVQLPTGTCVPAETREWRAQHNVWAVKYVKPYLERTLTGGKLTIWAHYNRHWMVYWGIVVEICG